MRFKKIWPVLLLALIVRLVGIKFNLPFIGVIWDESYSISYILRALDERSLFSTVNPYPLMLAALQAPFIFLKIIWLILTKDLFTLTALKNFFAVYGAGIFIDISRYISAILGVSSVYLIFLIFKKTLDEKSAYAAAFAASVNFLAIGLSHWGKAHMVVAFFFLGALYSSIEYEKNRKMVFFYLSIICASFSLSTHYLGLASFSMPLISFIRHRDKFTIKQLASSLIVAVTILICFYLPNIYGIKSMVNQVATDYYGVSGTLGLVKVNILERFTYFFTDLLKLDPAPLLVFLFFTLLQSKKILKNPYFLYIYGAIIANYLVTITFSAWPGLTRWLMFFSLLTGSCGLALLAEGVPKKSSSALLILLILVPTLASDTKWLYLLKNHTRNEAHAWIAANIRPSAPIYSYDQYLNFYPSPEAIKWRNNWPFLKDFWRNKILVDSIPGLETRDIRTHYSTKSGSTKPENEDYIVISYFSLKERSELVNDDPKIQVGYSLIKKIAPTTDEAMAIHGISEILNNPTSWLEIMKLSKSGPWIEIYKKNNPS